VRPPQGSAGDRRVRTLQATSGVSLVIGLPAMFVLGLALMGVCDLFRRACERI
jgi:hypothetical protein